MLNSVGLKSPLNGFTANSRGDIAWMILKSSGIGSEVEMSCPIERGGFKTEISTQYQKRLGEKKTEN
jgi:hypothetical protein